MNPITLPISIILVGFSMAFFGAYMNPMSWTENYNGVVSASTYVYIFLSQVGFLIAGYGICKATQNINTTE